LTLRAALPISASDGDSLTIEVHGAVDFRGRQATIHVSMVTSLDTMEAAAIGGSEIESDGKLVGVWPDVTIGREAAVFVSSIEVDGSHIGVDDSDTCVLNPGDHVVDNDAAHERLQSLHRQQIARYAVPLGDKSAPGAVEHFVVCAIERLLTTTKLKLPGIQIFPVTKRPIEAEQRDVMNHILEVLGRFGRVDDAHWARMMGGGRPWTAVVFPEIWAPDAETAGGIARVARDELLALFGVNRTARGIPVATVVEQIVRSGPPHFFLSLDDAGYRGNLLGGFISGEDQFTLVAQQHAIHADPLLHLCADLFSEAVADPSLDARFFRYWSILETLSGARVSRGQPVTLVNGSAWPGGGDTSQAAPRVYQYVSSGLAMSGVNVASQVAPAPDLYTAVRAWYGRRNATGHYGRFVLGDPSQRSQGWYRWAKQTSSDPDMWVWALRENCRMMLNDELIRAGSAAL
jgi:hypothetical protein